MSVWTRDKSFFLMSSLSLVHHHAPITSKYSPLLFSTKILLFSWKIRAQIKSIFLFGKSVVLISFLWSFFKRLHSVDLLFTIYPRTSVYTSDRSHKESFAYWSVSIKSPLCWQHQTSCKKGCDAQRTYMYITHTYIYLYMYIYHLYSLQPSFGLKNHPMAQSSIYTPLFPFTNTYKDAHKCTRLTSHRGTQFTAQNCFSRLRSSSSFETTSGWIVLECTLYLMIRQSWFTDPHNLEPFWGRNWIGAKTQHKVHAATFIRHM